MVRVVAAAEEAALLGQSASAREERGSPESWSLLALVGHNTEFKAQQVTRLRATLDGETPPAFSEIEHASEDTYRRFSGASREQALASSRVTTVELLDLLWELPEADLIDPSLQPWLRGRPLWLQVVVRGFWHPGGHLGEYWLSHGQSERTLQLHRAGVALAEAMALPGPALGMARYALACAEARVGNSGAALEEVARAIAVNPDLAKNAARDPDLQAVRSLAGWVTNAGSPDLNVR
jgi:hypothetical protein